MSPATAGRIPRWAWAALAAILLFDIWYRGHTIGPTVQRATGLRLWPVVTGRAEPLDCDEAVYAYIGRRLAGGAVMYRDLTENKPPGGYWLYAAAAAIGGANELTIRLMPVPMILATLCVIWWIGYQIRGPGTGCVAALLYAVLSTDPFLFGNGANMEHAINLFATASLAFMIKAIAKPRAFWLLAAGTALGAAALVKQIAILHLFVYSAALLATSRCDDGERPLRSRIGATLSVALGAGAVLALAGGVLVLQGAGNAAYQDIFRYGAALATDTPPDANSPPFFLRCITGNADPSGGLPPPFGKSTYLVWWGTGSWPLWIAMVPALAWLGFVSGTTVQRRLVAAWTVSACVQVVLPRLFWQHYYLLPTPGIALCVAVCVGDAFAPISGKSPLNHPGLWRHLAGLAFVAAVLATVAIQARLYLGVPPEELTARYKGGRQWVALRALSAEIAKRSRSWPEHRLFIWGWQSPLYIYTGFDGVSRQVFVDPLIKAYATTDHPLIRPRIERIMTELHAQPPDVVFVGDAPFPELREFLYQGYLRSHLVAQAPDGRGLWIARDKFAAFEYGLNSRSVP